MTDIRDDVTLEIRYGGELRRVRVELGAPALIPHSRETRRRLRIASDRSECTGLVEAEVSWSAVLAQVEMLLALEGESRAAAHIRQTTDAQIGRGSS
ncbi:MAG: hypothetical protein F4Y47_00245 [Acidobacteriia bacterium]|nr:hypothetical protein [Terriglobia bacterium]MYG04406.1 hypothetical protein [Terriglobia bacterium]MYK11271.1 hypothetical protein [Terriglobia bacterium]